MKVKIEKVNIGLYEYDSIIAKIDNKKTEIVFKKEDKVIRQDNLDDDKISIN